MLCYVFFFFFNLTASGPAECYFCLANDAASCSKYQWNQTCSSLWSLGRTHCGSAVGKYRHQDGSIKDHFYRNCVNCDSELTFKVKKVDKTNQTDLCTK